MNEHTLHTRRQFLRTGVLGGALAWTLPVFLEKTFFALNASAADSLIQAATGRDAPILVVLQLAGGNDGLNTVIPYSDDAYHAARPGLGIAPSKVLKIDDHMALNARLRGLRGLYDSGDLAVIQGVGYPNPNRSHFRSTDIWQTASDATRHEREGWIGRYFDSCCNGTDPAVGVSIGQQAPLAFASDTPAGITLSDPKQFRFISENASDPEATGETFRDMADGADNENAGGSVQSLSGQPATGGDTLDFLRRTALDAQMSSDQILEVSRKSRATVPYPSSKLADGLNLIARLIGGGMSTRIYYLSQGGYDTHSRQTNTHERLLGDLDTSLSAFVADLKAQGNFDRVVLMTFSEFGRRVAENSGGGTDHGAAAPMFVLGGSVKPGLYGRQPSLTQLNRGDLIYNVDFRSVYASVLENWLKVPSEGILNGHFANLGFV